MDCAWLMCVCVLCASVCWRSQSNIFIRPNLCNANYFLLVFDIVVICEWNEWNCVPAGKIEVALPISHVECLRSKWIRVTPPHNRLHMNVCQSIDVRILCQHGESYCNDWCIIWETEKYTQCWNKQNWLHFFVALFLSGPSIFHRIWWLDFKSLHILRLIAVAKRKHNYTRTEWRR